MFLSFSKLSTFTHAVTTFKLRDSFNVDLNMFQVLPLLLETVQPDAQWHVLPDGEQHKESSP